LGNDGDIVHNDIDKNIWAFCYRCSNFLTATMIILTIMGYIVKMNREIGEIKIHMINSFKKVRNDINTLSTKK